MFAGLHVHLLEAWSEKTSSSVHTFDQPLSLCFLTDASSGLDWHTRYRIIKGTCEGLKYLHEENSTLHLNLNLDNILLDNDMQPKLSDSDLSRLLGAATTTTSMSYMGKM